MRSLCQAEVTKAAIGHELKLFPDCGSDAAKQPAVDHQPLAWHFEPGSPGLPVSASWFTPCGREPVIPKLRLRDLNLRDKATLVEC